VQYTSFPERTPDSICNIRPLQCPMLFSRAFVCTVPGEPSRWVQRAVQHQDGRRHDSLASTNEGEEKGEHVCDHASESNERDAITVRGKKMRRENRKKEKVSVSGKYDQ